MHQHAEKHVFTPILHKPLNILPAPMGTQDSRFNTYLPRGTVRPSFAPVTAFHRAAQKPFKSTKQGRWGALHVCIAWKIYYNEQLKKMQHKPNSLPREVTPEYPATSLHDTLRHKEPDQPHTDSPCGNTGNRNESHFNRSYPSDLHTSSAASLHGQKLEKNPNLQWTETLDEREKHGGKQFETTTDLPLRDKSWYRTPELDGRHVGSLDRKRQLECDSSTKVKRVRQDIVHHHFDSSSPFSHTHHPHAMPVQHINSDLSVLYPRTSRCTGGSISHPGAEMHPNQSASWETALKVHRGTFLHSRQSIPKDYSSHTCKAIRIPLVAQRQKEALCGFRRPPLYFPVSLRQQETFNLHSRHENCHLQHPGYMAASYLGP